MDKKKILLMSLIFLILIPNALAFNPFDWIKSFFVARAPQIVKAEIYPEKIKNIGV